MLIMLVFIAVTAILNFFDFVNYIAPERANNRYYVSVTTYVLVKFGLYVALFHGITRFVIDHYSLKNRLSIALCSLAPIFPLLLAKYLFTLISKCAYTAETMIIEIPIFLPLFCYTYLTYFMYYIDSSGIIRPL